MIHRRFLEVVRARREPLEGGFILQKVASIQTRASEDLPLLLLVNLLVYSELSTLGIASLLSGGARSAT